MPARNLSRGKLVGEPRQNKGSGQACTTETSCYAHLFLRRFRATHRFSPSMSDTVIQPRRLGHSLAGQKMSGARMIMQVLADEGVTAIFGYSGGAILPTYDAVFL